MSSEAINTVIKTMESLAEDKQDNVVEYLREYIQDLHDIQECTKFYNKPQEKLDFIVKENYILIVQDFLTPFRH